MPRAGRPRKQGPRYQNGRLKPKKDVGTDELRAKKVALVGPNGDPTKSTNVIDILESWGHHEREQSKALHYFVKVRNLMIGKAAPKTVSIEQIKGTPPDQWMSDEQAIWWWFVYREMDRAMPPAQINLVRNIIFDDDLPRWYNSPQTPGWWTGNVESISQALTDCQRWKSQF
jgi:hypothetical protein